MSVSRAVTIAALLASYCLGGVAIYRCYRGRSSREITVWFVLGLLSLAVLFTLGALFDPFNERP